jgi:hypothetical protein
VGAVAVAPALLYGEILQLYVLLSLVRSKSFPLEHASPAVIKRLFIFSGSFTTVFAMSHTSCRQIWRRQTFNDTTYATFASAQTNPG